MTLAREDFAAIFRAVHGAAPFAWQTRLLHQVIERGWPRVIAAPTGAGKTAVLDIALFHLALEAGAGANRAAPRRIVFAVDRRIIVDQAFDRARKLRFALAQASQGPVAAMAAALRNGPSEPPLHVAQLRGGMPREDDWARSPAQPTILCTTIDQLGSRLLFRGYGVTPGMAPIHAGLLGEDALLLLDEAHLSNPFRETLNGIGRHRKRIADGGAGPLALPWESCALTATPAAPDEAVFWLTPAERAEPAVARRLSAAKTAGLELCKEKSGTAEHAIAVATAAESLVSRCARPDPTIAVILNRVSLARLVLDELRRRERDAILLTGRVRPIERDRLVREYASRLFGLGAEAAARPLFVVATQCIEAGADFDFDAMVTALAPLDSLRQRFGRLNRRGEHEAAPALIVAAKDEIARGADDPIYGGCARTTWEWLAARVKPLLADDCPSIEVGPDALDLLLAADPEHAASCAPPLKSAPVLRSADVSFFATTNPFPHPDPHLPLYLRGEVNATPEVSIVWRADCDVVASSSDAKAAKLVVACLPPRSGEALRVPIWAARAWLAGSASGAIEAAEVADVEGDAHPDPHPAGGRRALRWRGPDDADPELVRAEDLHPGDVIVVPRAYGGCDSFGWAPSDRTPVADIADDAAAPYAGRRYALRLHSSLWPPDDGCAPWSEVHPKLVEAAEDGARSVIEALKAVPGLPSAFCDRLEKLGDGRGVEIVRPYGDGESDRPVGLVLIATRGARGAPVRESAEPSTEDDDAGSFSRRAVTIAAHAEAVAQQAVAFATNIGLGPALTNTIAFAARHHDDGKADPRFQAWLSGLVSGEAEPLAKSGRWRGRAAETAAREAASMPPKWRHEVLSVRVAAQLLAAAVAEIDSDLALFLIGSHHGQGRPFFAHHDPWDAAERTVLGVALAPAAGPERLDFDWLGMDWAELFTTLQSRYGAWGLALLEAVLRLADHRVSGAKE